MLQIEGMDDINIFSDLLLKLKTKPSSVGFTKKEFNKQEKELIDGMYEAINSKEAQE
jgi:hypothetical protein